MTFTEKIKRICVMLLYEDECMSLTRVLAVACFMLFSVVSIYLVVSGVSWGNYETFATLTGGGGAVTQIANKMINSKMNSLPGSFQSTTANGEVKNAFGSQEKK